MATSGIVANRHDERSASSSASHGPVPGSPTLTNPDMILPDYDAPDSPQGRGQSPIMLWQDPNIVGLDFQLPPTGYAMPTSTPIIYGNGTMLSDIGEVTEVESTIGPGSRRASSRYSAHTDDAGNTTPLPNPSFNKAFRTQAKTASRERRSSIESTSTITTQDHHLPDFDDSVSIGDSSFQGDDEESMASSYVEGTAPQKPRLRGSARGLNEDGSALSHRAEQILANAKRRLTAMEDNLTRARSSLAYTSMSDYSNPSPGLERPATAVQDPVTPTTLTHSRNKSEDGIRGKFKLAPFPQRSASALGAAGGYRQQPSVQRRDAGSSRSTNKISHHPLDTTLQPLHEDHYDDDFGNAESIRDDFQHSSYLSPTFGPGSDKFLVRSASAAQVRGLQDQMHDLKGKISSLKEQARADSMKRRSLQSLRTPSPFTHARWEHGYVEQRGPETPQPRADGMELPENQDEVDSRDLSTPNANGGTIIAQEDGTFITRGAGSCKSESSSCSSEEMPQPGQTAEAGEVAQPGVIEEPYNTEAQSTRLGSPQAESADLDSDGVSNECSEDDPDWASDGGDSQYHDTFQETVSHEDREDAFDYEHFFLHSAMGSLTRARSGRRGSSGSESSEDSVETTRGPTSSMSKRRRSFDTVASEDSFATATEGRASRSSATQVENGYDEYSVAHQGTYEAHAALRKNLYGNNSGSDEDKFGGKNFNVHQRSTSHQLRHVEKLHRPSISSFESTGTNRSFPLVNKAKLNGGVLTPGGSPDNEVIQMSDKLMKLTEEASEEGESHDENTVGAAFQALSREDQISVERLILGLGKCVRGLGESSRAGSEARSYRRRIDEARRVLTGEDEAA